MRRSICYCEPASIVSGDVGTWNFIYTTAVALPKGTRLKFELGSKGRDIDWEIPSVNLKQKNNLIYGLTENGKVVQATEVDNPKNYSPDYEFILPQALGVGASFTIVIGAPSDKKKASPENGNRTQCNSQRRRTFNLHIDPTGKRNFEEAEVFSLDVRGNELHSIRILAPSFVVRNKRFDVILRFEDQFGNLTSNTTENTLIELSHENLRDNLKWKLFVPETGFINLPNLYFNEPGFYTIQLYNTRTKETFRSSPIKCFPENNRHLFWGLFHGESERVDSTENIESCLRHFRDDRAINFYGVSPFENAEETPNEVWKAISQNVAEFDEADRFTTFLGFQWDGDSPEEGLRNFVYCKDGKQILRKKEAKNSSLKKIYKSFAPKEIISIPTFTMGKGFEYNFKNFDPQFERVVEIYNSWGSSETTAKEGNPLPISSNGKKGIQESAEGAIVKALLKNYRFGFVAGGLDDRGVYSALFEGDQVQYTPGLTAIISAEHTRPALAEALYNRSCYATTGERMIVGLNLAGVGMGGEVSSANKPGLLINRHLSGFVAGTAKLASVELIRNGKVLKTFTTDDYHLDFTYDDMVPLEKVALQDAGNKKNPPFVFYYLRVIQEDGHMAWSSPIWVDLLPPSKDAIKRPTRPAAKAASPVASESFEDDDFDEEDEDEEDEV